MIFELLDEEVLDALEDMHVNSVLERLVQAHALGHHIFLPSRSILRGLAHSGALSLSARDMLRKIRDTYSEIEALANYVKFTSEIVRDTSPPSGTPIGRRGVKLSIRNIIEGRFLELPVFVFENAAQDGAFWRIMLQSWLEYDRFDIRVAFDCVHGGGSTTAEEFARQAAARRWSLCIVDSDVRFPNGVLGSTARRLCEQFYEMLQMECGIQCFSWIVILPVRELENFLPPWTLDWLFDNAPEGLRKIEALSLVYRLDCERQVDKDQFRYRFLDLKQGHRIRDDDQEALANLIVSLIADLEEGGFTEYCANETIAIGLGERIISRFVGQTIDHRPSRQRVIANLKRSMHWSEIKEILETILSLAAVVPAPRTRFAR